jgi:hypothetical protein
MKIEYLYIDRYKNLSPLEVYFEPGSTINALAGKNGSGKSNILEAIALIFTFLMTDGRAPEFEFNIKYTVYDNDVEINGKSGNVQVLKNKALVTKNSLKSVLPTTLFLYYAGETDRLKNIANEAIDKNFDRTIKIGDNPSYKATTLLSINDFGLSLTAIKCYKNDMLSKLESLLGIEQVSKKCTLQLKQPRWSKNGDPELFWNARGYIADVLVPIRNKGEYKIINSKKSSIILDNCEDLREDSMGPDGLFKILKILMQADILERIDIDVVKDGVSFDCNQLSEGEKQIGNLVSIINFTRDYRALFLLDEFDTYLHPSWQRAFTELIGDENLQGQILFTTHSPLTLGKMRKENIILLKNGGIYNPSAGTFNRDITEILEEVMEVSKRPINVEKAISDFRNAAMHGKKDIALVQLEQLQKLLSPDDPFFITAKHLVARLEG